MNLFGVYFQEEKNHFELVFIGSKADFVNIDDYLIYESFAMDKKSCDYDRESFIVVIEKDTTLNFKKNVVCDKNFLYTQLLKENKNIKIKVKGKEVTVKVK